MQYKNYLIKRIKKLQEKKYELNMKKQDEI